MSRAGMLALSALLLGCGAYADSHGQERSATAAQAAQRDAMIRHLAAQGIEDGSVLRAMRAVPRHAFVPAALQARAYENRALPVGEEQTISQPYIVALMTQLARVRTGDKVLEVGTGSGYQAAVLAEVGAKVFTIEIIPGLASRARRTLESLGYQTIDFRVGDGYQGWPEMAPFRAILVTAAPDHVPQPLVGQLALGGRLVIPVGATDAQKLLVVTRTKTGAISEEIIPVRFVPMTGEADRQPIAPPR